VTMKGWTIPSTHRVRATVPGHANLTMTQRYVHLSPAALDAAIRLLRGPLPINCLETE
jgi:hypothetical protein